METIPRYRAAHLVPYLDFLRKLGAPVERALRQAKLPTMVEDRPGAYLPSLPTFAFLATMSEREDVDELGLRSLQRLSITDLNERVVAGLRGSAGLYDALERFGTLVCLEDPCIRLWIRPGKNTVELCSSYRRPLDQEAQAYQDWSVIVTLITIVREFADPAWQPQEIAFHSDVPRTRYAFEQFPNTRLFIGQQTAWISVPRELLALRIRDKLLAEPTPSASSSEKAASAEAQSSFSSSLREVLALYLRDGYPPIELAAEIASTSIRTLQRKLEESLVTYSDLIQQVRFEAATNLLRDTDAKAIDIAYEVGYTDPSHFTRAFRRIAGMSPREYRRWCRPH